MVLSELTNKELKSILRENDVRNYSKLNKKDLVKKVNQLIKAQNGGKSGKGKNGKKKKYTLKDLIGGEPPVPLTGVNSNILPNVIKTGIAPLPPANPTLAPNQVEPKELIVNEVPGNAKVKAPENAPENAPRNAKVKAPENATGNAPEATPNSIVATAPPLSQNEIKKLENNEEARKLNEAKKLSLENQLLKKPSNQVNNKNEKTECGGICSIL